MSYPSWFTFVLLAAIPFNWLLIGVKFLFSPLSIPKGRTVEFERELALLVGIVLSTVGFVLGSVIVLIGLYFAFFPAYPSPTPFRPKLALAELAAAMLAYAMVPWLIFGPRMPLDHPGELILALIYCALPFALAVMGACNRADASNVPAGVWRAIYVATFPLMIVVLLAQPLILLPWPGGMTVASNPILQMAVGYALVILETIAGYWCRTEACAKAA